MSATTEDSANVARRALSWALALIVAAYAGARLLEIVPSPVPRLAVVALDVCSALAFALVDGTRRYGLRTMAVFCGICIVVGNAIENLGVATGFPYGHYYFTSLMGPKLFHVPVLLGLAYVGMAYVSWTIGSLIAGAASPTSVFVIPLIASFVMVAWDLAQDPVWATALHGWVWRDGGPWFGVPVSNYLGWYGTVFIIFLLFSLYLKRKAAQMESLDPQRWRITIVFYAVCALFNAGQMLKSGQDAVVRDGSAQAWRVGDITAASALVSIFLMGGLVVAAWIMRKPESSPIKV